jgi:hypothetical protein
MDFTLLSDQEISDFLRLHNQIPSGNRTIRIQQAQNLFNRLQQNQDSEFTLPVADLYLATLFLQANPSSTERYTEQQLRSLTPEYQQIFAQIFNLDSATPNFIDRLVRIIGYVGLLDTPQPIQSNVPKVIQSSVPKVIQPSVPKVIQPSVPKVIQPSASKPIQSSVPKVIQPNVPKVIQPSVPKPIQPSVPKVIQPLSSPSNIQRSEMPAPLWTWSVLENETPIPVTYPVILRYQIDAIEAWRTWIGLQLKTMDHISITDLQILFNLYDRYFFNGTLPKAVSLEFSDRLTKTAGLCGRCTVKGCVCEYKITIARKVFQNINLESGQSTQSGGIACDTSLQCLQLTLEHEMIHLIIKHRGLDRPNLEQKIYGSHAELLKHLV